MGIVSAKTVVSQGEWPASSHATTRSHISGCEDRDVTKGVCTALVCAATLLAPVGPAAAAGGGPCPRWVSAASPAVGAGIYPVGRVPVGPTKAALNAVAPVGAGEVVIQYGRGAYMVCGPVRRLGTGAGSRSVEILLRALQPESIYHYRLVARTATGSLTAPMRTFHTLAAGTVPYGVSVGPVAVGGKSREQARALIGRALAAPLRMDYAGAYWHVDRATVGAQLDVGAALTRALTADPGETLPAPRPTLDRGRLEAYVASLAAKWDRTAAAPAVRLVGTHAVVTPAQRGLVVDRAKTRASIARQLLTDAPAVVPLQVTEGPLSGASQQKAVVVRLGSQTLTAYLDGKPVLQTPVTTGRPALPTPIGSYSIQYRASPYTFISPWPPGNPFYYPPATVTWAMYFYDNDFLHDDPAEPSSAYGAGSEYGPYASHGCVHVPHDAMAFLWDWLPVGAPVIVSQT